MNYDINAFVGDFSRRTMKNLKHIKTEAEKEDREITPKKKKAPDIKIEESFFEVTQLVNSLLGLIVIPAEIYKNEEEFKDVFLHEKYPNEYEKILSIIRKCKLNKKIYYDYDNEINKYTECIYVSAFIRHLRNSIAHGGNKGLHFIPVSKNKEIEGIYFYDNRKKDKEKYYEFCVFLSIKEIYELVYIISRLFQRLEKDNFMSKKSNLALSLKADALSNLLKTQQREDKTKSTIDI